MLDASAFISPGVSQDDSFVVESGDAASVVGSGSLDVLATPVLVAYVERVASKMLAQRLPPELSSVGIFVEVHHLAPTPIGAHVRVLCQVVGVEGPRVEFFGKVWDDREQIGDVCHQRVLIDVTRFLRRVEAKQER